MANKKYLDQAGLQVLWDAIKAKFVDEDELAAELAQYVTSVSLAAELAKYVKLDDYNGFKATIEGRVADAESEIQRLWTAIGAIELPEYTMQKQSDAGDYAAVYKLLKDGVQVGDAINIAKNQLLKDVSIKVCTTKDVPVAGLVPGDKYIDFEFETTTGAAHSYLAVKDMVTPYTAGSGIEISANNVISVVNKTDRLVQGTNGSALMFNEADGGGAKFEGTNGVESFVGVNDGTNGVNAQIYVDKLVEGKWQGTKIDVNNNGAYYTVGNKSAAERMIAANEIAVKGDVNKKVDKELQGTYGTALIFNEADGGGSKFVQNGVNAVESFVGVNDGTNGINAQIYADVLVDGKWQGAKIDVSNGGAYYTVGSKSAAERMVAANEIATKGDVEACQPESMTQAEIEEICK